MRKLSLSEKHTSRKERPPMMQWPPKHMDIKDIKPMTEEEAERITQVLKASEELGKRILARRKGKPLPSSWRLIREAREERPQRI